MIIDFRRLKKSFSFAFSGLKIIVRKEQNFRIHFAIGILVVILGAIFRVNIWEWIALLLMIFFIFLLEIVNTVFERFVDMLKPRLSAYAKEIKDLMSAAVLIAAILSIIIGLIIFIPRFIAFFN